MFIVDLLLLPCFACWSVLFCYPVQRYIATHLRRCCLFCDDTLLVTHTFYTFPVYLPRFTFAFIIAVVGLPLPCLFSSVVAFVVTLLYYVVIYPQLPQFACYPVDFVCILLRLPYLLHLLLLLFCCCTPTTLYRILFPLRCCVVTHLTFTHIRFTRCSCRRTYVYPVGLLPLPLPRLPAHALVLPRWIPRWTFVACLPRFTYPHIYLVAAFDVYLCCCWLRLFCLFVAFTTLFSLRCRVCPRSFCSLPCPSYVLPLPFTPQFCLPTPPTLRRTVVFACPVAVVVVARLPRYLPTTFVGYPLLLLYCCCYYPRLGSPCSYLCSYSCFSLLYVVFTFVTVYHFTALPAFYCPFWLLFLPTFYPTFTPVVCYFAFICRYVELPVGYCCYPPYRYYTLTALV